MNKWKRDNYMCDCDDNIFYNFLFIFLSQIILFSQWYHDQNCNCFEVKSKKELFIQLVTYLIKHNYYLIKKCL